MSPGWSPAVEAAIERALAASATRHYIHIDHLAPVIQAARADAATVDQRAVLAALDTAQAALDTLRATIEREPRGVA